MTHTRDLVRSARLLVIAILIATGATPSSAAELLHSTETRHFILVDDPRVNLFHFLSNWAAADAGQRPAYASPLVERDVGLDGLTTEQRAVWLGAVAVYGQTVGRSLVTDRDLVAVRDAVIARAAPESVAEADRPLLAALELALPVYQARWWFAHDAANRKWIADLLPLLRDNEEGIARRLAAAYGATWPARRLRVDVVAHANFVGAYSVGDVLTVASGDPGNRAPQALEILFHEASHVDGLEQPLRAALAGAFAAEGGTEPDRLWHDLVFFTAGEATRLELALHGQSDYQHYGSFGVYLRGERWPRELAAFRAAWQPFLASGSGDSTARTSALRRLARSLLAPSPPPADETD